MVDEQSPVDSKVDLTDQRPPKPLGTAFRGSACKDNLTYLNLEGHRSDKVVQCNRP